MILNGTELAAYIKSQQQRRVRSFQSATRNLPKLAIVQCGEEVVSSKYRELKHNYGQDIGVEVVSHIVTPDKIKATIEQLNEDDDTHGVILQLPLPENLETDALLNHIDRDKDVDGLGVNPKFDSPTPTAILWLLSGYNIELKNKAVGMVGQGRLVGAPLVKLLQSSGITALTCDLASGNLAEIMSTADIVITATGQPGLISSSMIRPGMVIVDAGTANTSGTLVGDVDPAAHERDDIKISPVPGGVGPLTVCALFANVITSFADSLAM